MSEEEKKVVEEIETCIVKYRLGICQELDIEVLKTILNLIQSQQKEIEKKDIDIIEAKESNRKLSEELKKKDKIINEIAPQIYLNKQQREEMKEYIWTSNKPKDFSSFVKQYFEKKVEGK